MEHDTKSPHLTHAKGGDQEPVDSPDDRRSRSTQGEEKLGSDERAKLAD
jgi:hypothetical protein